MTTLKVDFSALDNLSNALDRTIEETEQVLAGLSGEVNRLAEMWTGTSAEGFRRTVANWTTAQQDLRDRLAGLRDLVRTAHDNHTRAVRVNAAMWRV